MNLSDKPKQEPNVQSRIYAMLQEATTLEAVEKVLSEITQATASLDSSSLWFLRRSAIELAQEIEQLDAAKLTRFAVSYILPLCKTSSEQCGGEWDLREMDSFRARQYLHDWLYGFPADLMVPIREGILTNLKERLKTEPTEECLWIISRIGYRDDSIIGSLWRIVEQGSERSDAAVSTLIALGPKQSDRDRLFEIVSDKLDQNQTDGVVTLAVQELVGPERIELAERLLNVSLDAHDDDDQPDASLVISVVTRAVDRCDAMAPVNERVWNAIRENLSIVSRSDEYGSRCASARVVPDYFDFILKKTDGRADETRSYILLTRLRDLLKPIHLESWNASRRDDLVNWLVEITRRDTENAGNIHTVDLSLKKEALETLVSLGYQATKDFIHDVILGETNAYASAEASDTLACFAIDRFPDTVIEAVKSGENIDQAENQHLFRHKGLIELVRSGTARSAFDALLQFGFTYKGNVLLSTIAAIIDVAIYRIRQGDTDIIEQILRVANTSTEKHHRDAAIATFCTLSQNGFVSKEKLSSLWAFVSDRQLGQHARFDALKAIGAIDSPEANEWRQDVIQIAKAGERRLSWQAWYAILKHEWLTDQAEQSLRSQLGIQQLGDTLHLTSARTAEGWQGYLLGMLFAANPSAYETCIVTCLVEGQPETVYQLSDGLKSVGYNCSQSVVSSLIERIKTANTKWTSEAGLFAVLSTVSITGLAKLAKTDVWNDWLPETKYAFCEALRATCVENEAFARSNAEIFVELMTDPAYQVRRSAYRACSEASAELFYRTCEGWSKLDDIELRRRAAEAVAWLPRDVRDEKLRAFGFAEDPEPAVREAWKGVILDRRQRQWVGQYLQRVLDHCDGNNQQIADNFQFGRAVVRLGDDDCIRRLRERTKDKELSANGRHWLSKIIKETKKQWKETTSKWPEPWADQRDSIEITDGEIGFNESSSIPAKITLWRQQSKSLLELYKWGGTAETTGSLEIGFDDREITLFIPGRTPTKISWIASNWSSSKPTRFTFFSNAAYPNAKNDD